VDAHSAMVMAQGFTQEQVQSILEDIDGSLLIDEKTKKLLDLAKKVTENSYQIHQSTIRELKAQGCSDEEIFEAISVTSLFNFMDRMADATGAPVEGMQEMVREAQNQ
jgi:alkylhydroperoxidase family enzyme